MVVCPVVSYLWPRRVCFLLPYLFFKPRQRIPESCRVVAQSPVPVGAVAYMVAKGFRPARILPHPQYYSDRLPSDSVGIPTTEREHSISANDSYEWSSFRQLRNNLL